MPAIDIYFGMTRYHAGGYFNNIFYITADEKQVGIVNPLYIIPDEFLEITRA